MKFRIYLSFRFKHFSAVFSCISIVLLTAYMIFSCFNENQTVMTISNEKPIIIIDAGHGGEDGGTQATDGTLEKDINLSIGILLNSLLKEKGFETKLVREGDYLVYDDGCTTIREKKKSDLNNRLKFVNQTPDCILLSIHQNYFQESKYSGAQVFYSGNNAESSKLARIIQDTIRVNIQPENTRQIKESGSEIFLLYNSVAPSVMIECGFLSNYEEAKKLKNIQYQNEIAKAIADGLTEYINRSEKEI